MDAQKNKMDEILYHAQRCIYFNKKTIEACNSWLSAEEGNKNMMKAINERKKYKKNNLLKSLTIKF